MMPLTETVCFNSSRSFCVLQLDGRLYGDNRVLKAFTWDGKTKYKVAETEESERPKKWDEFLVGEGAESKDKNDLKPTIK